jgi:divalent metal cation (Fe/Co/Zn/Cd) transporter
LEALSLVWMLVEGIVSIGSGVAAGSVLLIAFGVDSIIELLSTFLLFWRLRGEAKGQRENEGVLEARERKAARIGGYLLYALALYVVVQAGYSLLNRHEAETSLLGFIVAAVAALGTPALARAKLRIAQQIGSRALRADAIETLTCGYLAWVVLAGLAANALVGWWWLDAAASLLIVPILIREAREAIRGEGCACH